MRDQGEMHIEKTLWDVGRRKTLSCELVYAVDKGLGPDPITFRDRHRKTEKERDTEKER